MRVRKVGINGRCLEIGLAGVDYANIEYALKRKLISFETFIDTIQNKI